MKNTKMILLFAIMAIVSACSKEDATEELLTEKEAAEIVESAVSDRSGGASTTTLAAVEMAELPTAACGISGDTIISKSVTAGPITFSTVNNIAWQTICNQLNIPTGGELTFNGTNSFNSNNWTGNATSEGELLLTGLLPTATVYTLNGNYDYAGTITGNLRRRDPSLNTSVAVELTSVTVSKQTKKITGGAGTVVISVTAQSGQNATLTGSLTFNGDGTATVTINGYSYTFPV